MGGVEDCNGGGQAGEPHALFAMFVTEDVSKPNTSWLKALASRNTVEGSTATHSHAQEISISTEAVMPTVQTGDARAQQKRSQLASTGDCASAATRRLGLE